MDVLTPTKVRIFLSYGRADAGELAERLEADLSLLGFEVWRDRRKIRPGKEWDDEIEAGLRTSQLVVAVLTPHAVREESVCRDELAFARFACKLPIVPALAAPCEPPFVIFRLDYIDLTAWRDSADQYKLGFKRLIDSIQAHLRGEPPRYRRWDDRFPQFDFGPFLYDRRRDFCGREWLFQRIDAWRADPGRQRALLITGDPGIGKSAIVAQLVHLNPGGQVLAYHCCRADTPETLRPSRFIRGLAGMIASQLDAYASQLDNPQVENALAESRCETDAASALEEGILNPLHRVPTPAGGTRYLLIDALDEALAVREGPSIVNLLSPSRLDRLPGWLRIVATTRKEPDVLRRLSGLRAEEIRADEPRNLDDLERYLARRLGQPRFQESLQSSGVSAEDAIRGLREKSGGNFLWAGQALQGLEDGTYDFADLDALPPGLTGLYLAFFERHFPDSASYAPARQVLEVVTAAHQPLTAPEIAAATDLDPDYELPALLDRLAAYLPDRDGHRTLYHKSLADWLTDTTVPRPAGQFFVSPRRGHQRLADWCWTQYNRGAEKMSPYALRHLPGHLIESSRWDDLAALLCDLPFLEAKAEAGYVFDLAGDITGTVDRMPEDHSARRNLRLLSAAIGADIQFLARHPTTLFQCLWNCCWWSDCPAAAAHYDPLPGGWPTDRPPWSRPAGERLSTLLERWRADKDLRTPGCTWLCSLRPSELALGSPQLACLRGHENHVTSVAYSSDGRRIVSGSNDKTARVWDAASGAELACLRGHENHVTSVAYSPDGRRIVSGSYDKTVRVWDAASGAELACLRGHENDVTSVAHSPDGRRIVSGSRDHTVRIWEAAGGAELACLRGHANSVTSVVCSPDGRWIVSASWDEVRVWDAASGVELARLRGHKGWVRSVAYSPDGRRIVSGSGNYDETVRVWDAASGVELACLRGHEHIVTSVAYSPDGRRIVSGSHDRTVRVWDAAGGIELARLRGHEDRVLSVAYSPDGRRIASGSYDKTVRVWDAVCGAGRSRLRSHESWVLSVAFSPHGRWIVSTSFDGTLRVWDAVCGAEQACLFGHEYAVLSFAYSPDGHRIVIGSSDNLVRVWDIVRGAELACLRGHENHITSVAYSPDGRRIVSGSEDRTMRVWDAMSGAQLACLRGHKDAVLSVAYSSDGRRIVSGSRDKTVRVWDAASGAQLARFRGHEDPVLSVAYSPDSRRIVSGSGWPDRTVRVRDTASTECLEVIQGSPDVAAIAAGGNAFPWRALWRGQETLIVPVAGGDPIAWFPVPLEHITTHPSGRIWAGSVRNHLYIIKLEGEPDPKPSGENAP
jgi:WD40 repeat protein